MHASCADFVKRICTAERIAGQRVLEVGAFNVNGSPRDWLLPLGPKCYIGTDIRPQTKYVDLVADTRELPNVFRPFDVVLSTETLEHVEDWRAFVTACKAVTREGGLLMMTARGPGFPRHDYPGDYWRFTVPNFQAMFADCEVIELISDPGAQGVLFAGTYLGTPVDLSAIDVLAV